MRYIVNYDGTRPEAVPALLPQMMRHWSLTNGEAGWKAYEIDASHNPHITCPDALMKLLTDIMNGK